MATDVISCCSFASIRFSLKIIISEYEITAHNIIININALYVIIYANTINATSFSYHEWETIRDEKKKQFSHNITIMQLFFLLWRQQNLCRLCVCFFFHFIFLYWNWNEYDIQFIRCANYLFKCTCLWLFFIVVVLLSPLRFSATSLELRTIRPCMVFVDSAGRLYMHRR